MHIYRTMAFISMHLYICIQSHVYFDMLVASGSADRPSGWSCGGDTTRTYSATVWTAKGQRSKGGRSTAGSAKDQKESTDRNHCCQHWVRQSSQTIVLFFLLHSYTCTCEFVHWYLSKTPAIHLHHTCSCKFIYRLLLYMYRCLNQCTYCKTKHARGDLGSYPPEEIIARAKQAFEGRTWEKEKGV